MESTTIDGIKVSPIGLGTSRLASLGARHSRREVARLLDAAFDLGVTFIDTSDTYGSTACERWLGEGMGRQPHRFVVATKCGLPTAHLRGPLDPLTSPPRRFSSESARTTTWIPATFVGASMTASGACAVRIEYYFLHSPPLGVERMDALFEVLDEAKARGKVAVYGVSSDDLRIIDAVARVRKCKIAQTAVNPQRSKELIAFLNSMDKIGDLELVANSVLADRNKVSDTGFPNPKMAQKMQISG